MTVDEAKKQLVISVADSGVGIPKEKRNELFKRFMQSSFRVVVSESACI